MQRLYNDIIMPDTATFFGRDASQTNGYLISGDSGCGKTLLVKALATKLMQTFKADKFKFYATNYSDITSTLRGGEAQGTSQLFELAKINENNGIKTLIFLDELQSVGVRHREYNEALDTLLCHLDGISSYKGLTFIGATYMDLDSIDPALKRRLRNQIAIPDPDEQARMEMIDIHIEQRKKISSQVNNKNLFANINLGTIAQSTNGFNGSKIARLIEVALQKKEDEVKANLGGAYLEENLIKALTPIDTQFILDVIPKVRTEGKKDTNNFIGFNN